MPDTLLAAARHEAAFETNLGESAVRAVPNRQEQNADRKLVDLVTRALTATGHKALRTLEVEISGGIVILWGRVPNYYQKQLAQEAAQRVEGVRGIANGLEVVCYR